MSQLLPTFKDLDADGQVEFLARDFPMEPNGEKLFGDGGRFEGSTWSTSIQPTIAALIREKTARPEAHRETETLAAHCRRCEGCPASFDPILDAEFI
jgi:hypothetical protein